MDNNACAKVAVNNENKSNGSIAIRIGEISKGDLRLKELSLDANICVTDEEVRIETDAVQKILAQFLGSAICDAIVRNIEADTATAEARKSYCEAQTKTEEARASRYEAETKTEEARAKKYEEEAEYWRRRQSEIGTETKNDSAKTE